MFSNHTYRNVMLLLLCLTSGIVDVIGYLGLGHVFTANMTGNIVLLGLAIGNSEELAVLRSMVAVVGFIAGTAVAAVIVGSNQEKSFWPKQVTFALSMEAILLILFAVCNHLNLTNPMVYLLITLLSIAMGIQTTAARRLGIAGISTTVLTNNLANVVEDVINQFRRLFQKDRTKSFNSESLLRLWAIVTYCLGAILGTAAPYVFSFNIVWLPICILVSILLTVFIRFREKEASVKGA